MVCEHRGRARRSRAVEELANVLLVHGDALAQQIERAGFDEVATRMAGEWFGYASARRTARQR